MLKHPVNRPLSADSLLQRLVSGILRSDQTKFVNAGLRCRVQTLATWIIIRVIRNIDDVDDVCTWNDYDKESSSLLMSEIGVVVPVFEMNLY